MQILWDWNQKRIEYVVYEVHPPLMLFVEIFGESNIPVFC